MNNPIRKTIQIPEIVRVEGHWAVNVDITDGAVTSVQLEVFEGTRFFERIVLGHNFSEIPHITSRVCAICATGHILAASLAIESIFAWQAPKKIRLLRELMHLGMIIESHATHIFALALPDFVGAKDLGDLATTHHAHFAAWTKLRNLGSAIQTVLGGRPFHPVNLHVGGFSHYPSPESLRTLEPQIKECVPLALDICQFFLNLKPAFRRTSRPCFVALIPEAPDGNIYGYFGTRVRSTDGWEESINQYKEYLSEQTVSFSHAKRATAKGKDMMVGSMARLLMFADRLTGEAQNLYKQSAIASGDTNTLWNNLGQTIEILQALDRAVDIISVLSTADAEGETTPIHKAVKGGSGIGAIECPRGTLYHSYNLDEQGTILAADLVTPSVQNVGRIELDIREVVSTASDVGSPELQANLETLVRAYDPCNTCATHMVSVKYR